MLGHLQDPGRQWRLGAYFPRDAVCTGDVDWQLNTQGQRNSMVSFGFLVIALSNEVPVENSVCGRFRSYSSGASFSCSDSVLRICPKETIPKSIGCSQPLVQQKAPHI